MTQLESNSQARASDCWRPKYHLQRPCRASCFSRLGPYLPPYLRKTGSLEGLTPWLYLKGVGTGDFAEAFRAFLGPNAPGLSAATVTRLKAAWEAEHEA
jgi:hypothetical protein